MPSPLRALFPWIQQGAAVDDGVGPFKACLTYFLALIPVVTHHKVHGVVAGVKVMQQLSVTFSSSILDEFSKLCVLLPLLSKRASF